MTSVWLRFEIAFNNVCRYFGDDNFIRVAHALETLTVLLREIFKKRFNEQVRLFSVLILCLPVSPKYADVGFVIGLYNVELFVLVC